MYMLLLFCCHCFWVHCHVCEDFNFMFLCYLQLSMCNCLSSLVIRYYSTAIPTICTPLFIHTVFAFDILYCVIKSCLYLDVKVCSCFLLVINKDLICRWVLVMCRQRRQAELPNVLYTTRWAIKVIKTNFYLIFQVSAAACWGCSGNYCVFCSKFLHFPVVKACPR